MMKIPKKLIVLILTVAFLTESAGRGYALRPVATAKNRALQIGDEDARQSSTLLPASFEKIFEYFCENKITNPEKAVTCGYIAKTLGRGYRTIMPILNGLSLHLHLVEIIEGETGKDTRYYMPEKIREKSKDILSILSRFKGKLFLFRPNVTTLDKVYRDEIIPIVGELPIEMVRQWNKREGLKLLSKIIAEVDDFDRKISKNDFPDLEDKMIGVTNKMGQIHFKPVPYFRFHWPILGSMKEGWEAVIEKSDVLGRYFQFKVKLTKGEKTIYKVFQIGRYTRELKGEKKKRGHTCKVLDIDDHLGLRGISELIIKPGKYNWEKADKRGELPDLTGLKTGTTSQNGTSNFSPILNYPFQWPVLGFKEKGWEGTIGGNGVVDGYFRFVLKLENGSEKPKYNIFQIGPYSRFLNGINIEKGLKKEVLNILSLEAIQRLAWEEDYKRKQGRPVFDFIGRQWDVEDISQEGLCGAITINELFNAASQILGSLRGKNREIASLLIGGSEPENIIVYGGYSRDVVKRVLKKLREKLSSFLKDYAIAEPQILKFSPIDEVGREEVRKEKVEVVHPKRVYPCAVTSEKYAEILEQNSSKKYLVCWQGFKWSKTWILTTGSVFMSIVPVLMKVDIHERADFDFGLGHFNYVPYDSNTLSQDKVDELTRGRNAEFFKFLEVAEKKRGEQKRKYRLFLFGGGYRNEEEKKIVQDTKKAMLKAFASVGVVDYVDLCAKEHGQILSGIIADPKTQKVYYHYTKTTTEPGAEELGAGKPDISFSVLNQAFASAA